MAGVQNDYNQLEGEPRIRIGNWVEERALLSITGQSRGSAAPNKNDTATRITGPVREPRDYLTTTNIAHEATLVAPHGPAFAASVAQPRRAQTREQERAALAQQIYEQQQAELASRIAADVDSSAFGGKAPQNRARALVDARGRSVEERAATNPLNGAAITFHTHHLGAIHGTTPGQKGVHTHGKDTTFSKPIEETFQSGER